MKTNINVEKLIEQFEDMAERGSFLTSPDKQGDLATQLTGVVAKLAMDEEKEAASKMLKNLLFITVISFLFCIVA